MDKSRETFIIKEGSNMLLNYFPNMRYIQQPTYKLVDNFYNWLIQTSNEDYHRLRDNNYEDFYGEYEQIVKSLLEKRQAIKNNHEVENLNIDSVERLKIIIEATIDEYKAIENTDDKDIVYFNNLLGWYEAIPTETDMFIHSLFTKQDIVDYIPKSQMLDYEKKIVNNVNIRKGSIYKPVTTTFYIEDCEDYQVAMTV